MSPIQPKTNERWLFDRTVQILEDQILARPIFYFLQHPEAPDLKKRLITGTRSEIESLKKNET